MTRSTRSIARLGAAVGAATVTLLVLAVPAFAHVEAEGETTDTGITTVTFGFTHGCNGSPTTSLKIKLPDSTTEVSADDPDGWTSSLDDTTLTWTGGSIPDSTPGSFVATMRLIGSTGDTVFLPTIQGCADGEEDWIELSPDAEAENAAPRIVLTTTVAPAPSSSTTATSTSDTRTPDEVADAKVVKDSENSNIGVIVIVIVVLIIVAGAVILYLRNRRPTSP